MAIRNIRVLGDEILRKKAKEITEVTPRIQELIDDMFETMYDADGVGLAAPQVTYILHQLKDNGFDVDPSATTIEEAKETILQAVRKNSK